MDSQDWITSFIGAVVTGLAALIFKLFERVRELELDNRTKTQQILGIVKDLDEFMEKFIVQRRSRHGHHHEEED